MAPVGTLCAAKQYMQKMTNTLCRLGWVQWFYYSICQGNASAGWILHCNRKILPVGTVWRQDPCHQQTCKTTEEKTNDKALLKKKEDGQQTWALDMSTKVPEMCPSNGDRSNTSPSVSNKTKMHFHIWNHCALLQHLPRHGRAIGDGAGQCTSLPFKGVGIIISSHCWHVLLKIIYCSLPLLVSLNTISPLRKFHLSIKQACPRKEDKRVAASEVQ